MKKRGWIYFIVIFLGCCWPLLAQFTPEEIAERERWEEFLGNAEVMSESQMDGRLAVTNPSSTWPRYSWGEKMELPKELYGKIHRAE